MADYPSAVKTFVQLEDGVDIVFAQHPNQRGDEITAVETELGVLPKGSEASVVARLNLAGVVKLTNKNGGSLALGDVVVQDTGNNSAVVATTTANLVRPVFVVRETVANDALGHVQHIGVATIAVTGTVTRGDYLATSTTTKKAKSAGTTLVGGVFGRALTADSGGTCIAILFGVTFSTSVGGWTNMQVFTSSGTWTWPTNVTKVFVRAFGSGGGGGVGSVGAGSNGVGGGGGSGGGPGAYAEKIVSVSANVTVTIGAIGDGGTSGVAATAGGDCSFGAEVIAKGGEAGSAGAGTGAGGAGASSTTGSTGTLTIRGTSDTGGMGERAGTGAFGGQGSKGGDSPGGGGGGAGGAGGLAGATGSAGTAGFAPGGGGGGGGGGANGGGGSGFAGGNGGAGALGMVIVYWNE